MLKALSPRTAELLTQWLALDKNPESRAAVEDMGKAGDEAGLARILGQRLEFGNEEGIAAHLNCNRYLHC
jgi:hypothetical protein